ncbi:MAG: T9SS type A sorting domain-containing protein [Bacteroidales bacterium]|nr:T9SS type A sorting domain-containing protein [Bacteroidales bacterium]
MKKIFTLLTAILLTINAFALDVWDGSSSPWTKGSGTSSDPYLIETAANLAYLAEKVNEGYQAQGMEVFAYTYFQMTDDLDLNNINWTPIGNVDYIDGALSGYYFAGYFDGWYHNIDHLKIQTSDNLTGLFAGLGGTQAPPPGGGGGMIMHLSVTNGNIISTGFGAGGIVGAIGGDSQVYQCSFSGTIQISNSDEFCGAGGILGATLDDAHASVDDSYNVGTLNGNTKGGIFGMISPINPFKGEAEISISNCYYLNTCGGTTNYGTSKTSAEMQTEQFKNQIDMSALKYVMDNGTNNGYPIHSLKGVNLNNVSDITAHSAMFSADLHPGNTTFMSVIIYCYDVNETDYHEFEMGTDGHVEITAEGLLPNTDYVYSMSVELENGGFTSSGPRWFTTLNNDNINEISDNSILIYPNPTSDFIHIDCRDVPWCVSTPITIYSLDGKLIKTVEDTNIVDVRDLNEGVYLIDIGGKVGKVIIER